MPKSWGRMGFRDMKLFNQALLARQAWRLIQYPNSLCAQILKAVFQGDVPPTWKAIVHDLELVKKGLPGV
jgi:hypothetical protein